MFIMACLLAMTTIVKGQVPSDATPGAPAVLPEHSPRKAILLSILPGAGQVYNGQAWKIPIIYGAFAATGYFVYDNYTRMRTFKEEYLLRAGGGEPQMNGYTGYPNSSIYNLYQSYNKNFQLMVILTGVVYGLNLIDAYVFGHLYDFQIDDNLTLNVSPSLIATEKQVTPGIACSFTF